MRMEIDYKVIGRNIKRARIGREITQGEVAEKLGFSENYYGRIERGEEKPSLERLFELCHLFSTPIEAFFEGSYDVSNFAKPPETTDYAARLTEILKGHSDAHKAAMLKACRAIAELEQ